MKLDMMRNSFQVLVVIANPGAERERITSARQSRQQDKSGTTSHVYISKILKLRDKIALSGHDMLRRNRIYRGETIHNGQSYVGEHEPIIDQPLWDAVQAQLVSNAAQRNDGGRTRQPCLLAGMLFDGDGNRMTPSHAVKRGTRYRYYVSGSLITKDRAETSTGLRIPAAEIEQLVSSRVHRWLLDPGSIYKSSSARLLDPSMQQRLVARAADIGKHWPELPLARKRAVLAALIERIEVSVD